MGVSVSQNELPPEKYFYLSNGQALKNLEDLKNFLRKNDSGTFSSHVSGQRNDFYNWIKFALEDNTSAEKTLHKTSPADMLESLESRVNFKSEILSKELNQAPLSSSSNNNLNNPKPSKDLRNSQKNAKKSVKSSKKPSTNNLSNSKSRKFKDSKKDYSLTSDIDYSLDLDDQRDALAKIRKRIESMDLELKSSSKYNSNILSKSLSKDSGSPFSDSLRELDNKYPELSHNNVSADELRELRSSKPKKKLHHHIKTAGRHVAHHLKKHTKKMHNYISSSIEESKRKSKIKKLTSSLKSEPNNKNAKHTSSSNSEKNKDENKSNRIKYEMDSFYGKPIDNSNDDKGSKKNIKNTEKSLDNNKDRSEKKVGFFSNFVRKFKKAEKDIVKHASSMNGVEHTKKAQEFLTYDPINHREEYHLHAVQDFVKGLIIGILIGMLFLAIF